MERELTSERKLIIENDFKRGFIEYCGFEGEIPESGHFISRVKVMPHHRQQDGYIHAGVMATMADHTAGYAAYTLTPDDFRILTIEFKINFLKPAFGEEMFCHAKIIKGGKQILVADSEVFDLNRGGKYLVAKAIVTLMAVHDSKMKKIPLS